MIRVLFVCLGNICRSPMAEGVFAHMVNEAGLSAHIAVDSAGTSGWHEGEAAHSGTRKVLRQHDIPYNGRSRPLRSQDLTDFTYVLAMDASNLHNIGKLKQETNSEVALFLSYANAAGLTSHTEVPDPYYDNRFNEVYELVELGCKALLDHIRKTHQL